MEKDSETNKERKEEKMGTSKEHTSYNYDLEDGQGGEQKEKKNNVNLNLNSSILENEYLNEKYSDNVENIVLTESLQ